MGRTKPCPHGCLLNRDLKSRVPLTGVRTEKLERKHRPLSPSAPNPGYLPFALPVFGVELAKTNSGETESVLLFHIREVTKGNSVVQFNQWRA